MLSVRLIPILLLFAWFRITTASVLAIDYGSDWIKASLMKPGIPFDIMLNKDSKRKMQASVGWKNQDRLFGGDAFNIAGRFPLDSFSSLKHLIGVPSTSPAAEYFTTISTVDTLKTLRDTVGFRRSDGSEWSTEELIAMQFAYVKGVASDLAKGPVTEVIVTVPPFYSQFERDALADAVEISGLRLLAMIHDGTGVAVNYAMTRTFSSGPENHVIYDAGASSVKVTVVTFAPEAAKGKKGGVVINTRGMGYARQVAGTELDRRMREILIKAFNTKHAPNDITTDKRGMAKLWKEASRVKAILSANNEASSIVEDLAFDIDFRHKVSRAEFETACTDLKDGWIGPLTDALEVAGMTLDNITSVILHGGASRIPMIQSAIREIVGEGKIAMNVNSDEAAVLGAALHGASLSRQFKTKSISVHDISPHAIQASYLAAPATDNAKVRTINSVIFVKGSKLGTKKVVTFKRKEDFEINLGYTETPGSGFPAQLLTSQITGVAEALANLTALGAVDPVIKATISLSASGFVSVESAVAFSDSIKIEEKPKFTDTLKGFFGNSKDEDGSSDDQDNDDELVVEEHPHEHGDKTVKMTRKEKREAMKAAEKAFKAMNAGKKDAGNKDKEGSHESNTIKLNVNTIFTASVKPMTVAEKKAARDRLRDIDDKESSKQRRENARNTFEGYLYRLRDLLEDEDESKPFKKCSQEVERASIKKKLDESMNWLHETGDNAETAQFYDKRNALETLERPIMHRYTEIAEFPHTLNMSQMWNWRTHLFLTEARQNLTKETEAGVLTKWTAKELDALEKSLKDHEKWLDEWVEKQKSVKFNEDPVINTTEMKARAKTLENHLQRLAKRKTPKPLPKKTSTTTVPTSSEESEVPSPDTDNADPPKHQAPPPPEHERDPAEL